MDKKVIQIPGSDEKRERNVEEIRQRPDPELEIELKEQEVAELRKENRRISLLNQQITQDNLYWKDQAKRLEQVVKAFEDEDSEKAKKLLKSQRWHSRWLAD